MSSEMQPRYRVYVWVVFLIVLLIPSVSGQATEDPTQRLEDIREELTDQEAEADSIRESVVSLDAAIRRDQLFLLDLEGEVESINLQLREVRAQIFAASEEISSLEDEAIRHATDLYKSGQAGWLEALLDSADLAELDARFEYLSAASKEDAEALIAYSRLKARVRAQNNELIALRRQLAERMEQRSTVLARLKERRATIVDRLAGLDSRIDRLKQREGRLVDSLSPTVWSIGSSGSESPSGFIWPLNGPVTSYYGPRWGRMHTGIDIDGFTGQPIAASAAGTVSLASYNGGYGNAVVVDHGGGVSTLYAHMSVIHVSVGEQVEAGRTVGEVGATGNVTGDHLHFEVRVNGSPQDPMGYLP
jgi:murein DD-endopeptidase MepM/ murein hydrolase activator NlpD